MDVETQSEVWGTIDTGQLFFEQKREKLTKSASTIYMCGRPKRLNTIEGKRHIGGILYEKAFQDWGWF